MWRWGISLGKIVDTVKKMKHSFLERSKQSVLKALPSSISLRSCRESELTSFTLLWRGLVGFMPTTCSLKPVSQFSLSCAQCRAGVQCHTHAWWRLAGSVGLLKHKGWERSWQLSVVPSKGRWMLCCCQSKMDIVLLLMQENPTVHFTAPRALLDRLAALMGSGVLCWMCCVSQAGEHSVALRLQQPLGSC